MLYQDVQLQQHALAAQGKMIKGRPVLHMINGFFKTNRQDDFIFTLVDLTALPWLGDREVATFRHRWDTIVDSLQDKVSEDTLASLLSSNCLLYTSPSPRD